MSHDPLWVKVFLAVHITAGMGSFVLAPVALATAKGSKQHRRWGMVYLWCMGVIATTALPMAIFRPVLFLAMVAVFSFYAAFAGYRVLKLKTLARGGDAEPIDWIAAAITFASSLTLALLGAFKPAAVQGIGIVSVVFGFLGMRLAYVQMKSFVKKPVDKLFWIDTHIGNFMGSYIAAWTAFGVVTLGPLFGNSWILWLWPTIVGVPAIILTIGYYRRKYGPKQATATA